MAGTRKLDWLTDYARERGAIVRLLGDPSQLSAVEAGGALRLLVHDAGAVELTQLHRFNDPAEATATLGLRHGKTSALDFYFARHRVTEGPADAMLESGYEAWANDTRTGLDSLLIAAKGADVAALNARARMERIHAGQVEAAGEDLRDGNRAGVGDRIVTRANQRALTVSGGRDFVKNGDTWTITRRHAQGDLTVQHTEHGGCVRLPSRYVTDAVELAYATTAAIAQGATVDTAHVLVDDTMTRESLYVAATRGRAGAHLYVPTKDLIGIDAERPPAPTTVARDLLEQALGRKSGERSATEVQRDNHAECGRLPQLIARYDFALQTALREHHTHSVRAALESVHAEDVLADPAFSALSRSLAAAESNGRNPVALLTAAATRRELDTARSVAQV
ncbi:MAG: ATP-dependent DNA helicase, partial [Stackebrandtia sp.]